MNRNELGEFLQSRRAGVLPAELGLPSAGRRRVRGLRREEVATLAGVSSSYYNRIEQGHAGQISPSVLGSIAKALRLNDEEQAHLTRLAEPAVRRPAGDAEIGPGLRGFIHRLDVPAALLGRCIEIVAWNRLAQLVFAPELALNAPEHPGTRPNWARILFLDPRCRELFVDWPGTARDVAGRIRIAISRHPHQTELNDLVQELRARSNAFDQIWSAHPVQAGNRGTVLVQHPTAGRLVFRDELLHPADRPDHLLAVMNVEPGSETESALRRLIAEST